MKKLIKFTQDLQQKWDNLSTTTSLSQGQRDKQDWFMHDRDVMEIDRGPGAIWEAAPPTQSQEDRTSVLSCPAPTKIKNSLSSSQKNPHLLAQKGQLCSINFIPIKQGQPVQCKVSSKNTNTQYSVPRSAKQVQSDFETLLHCSSLLVVLHFYHFMRQTVLF